MTRKEIEHELRSFSLVIEKCQKCNGVLIHDYYTDEERKANGMNLGKKQRNSFCQKCKILYINNKP